MRIKVRKHDRMYCLECGAVAEEGEEVLLIDDMTLCLSCSVEYLLAKIESLERRLEESKSDL